MTMLIRFWPAIAVGVAFLLIGMTIPQALGFALVLCAIQEWLRRAIEWAAK